MNPQNKIYTVVINLRRSIERRHHMEKTLSHLNIPFTLLDATEGDTYNLESGDSKTLSKGELGCAHSHRRALADFLESSKAFGLIMEDDIDIDERFATNVLTAIGKWSRDEKIYIQFDYAPVGIKGVYFWWFLFGNLLRNNRSNWVFWCKFPIYLIKGISANFLALFDGLRDKYYTAHNTSNLVTVMRDHYLAGCYLVSRSAAKELIKVNTPLLYPADAVHNIARRRNKIRHYIAIPRVIRQKREIFSSTLNNEHFGKKVASY